MAVPMAPSFRTIERHRQQVGLSMLELWLRYIGVGGDAGIETLERYLTTGEGLGESDYNLLAAALNDEFVERGLDHPVRYR